MNSSLIIFSLLFSLSTIANDKKDSQQQNKKESYQKDKPYYRGHQKPVSAFDIIPLNSPVKETTARFLLKVPSGFDIDEVMYKVKNASRLFEKDQPHKKINLVDGPEGKELRIAVSKLPPGFFQLFVKVRDRKHREYDYKNKYKDHAMFVVDNSLQVPLPDSKKNDATIAGVDSDNDGIRDDIQRWINEEYSSQPKLKLAIKQVAMGMQLALTSVDNKEQSIAAANKVSNDMVCMASIIGANETYKMISEINAKLLNTKNRHYAEIKSNSNYSGQTWELPNTPEAEKALCSFNPDNF